MEDSGALPIEVDVSQLNMGDVIDIIDHDGKITRQDGKVAESSSRATCCSKSAPAAASTWIIGRGLTAKARAALGLPPPPCSVCPGAGRQAKGFTLAQKMVGRACGLPEGQGIRPGTYCEPKMTTVGSQDTTGPMTRDELKGPGLPGLLGRHGDAVVLPHRRLPEAGGREDPPRAAGLHQQPRRRGAAPGRRRDPLLAQPPAAARHRGHRRRQPPASRSASASRPAPAWWLSRAATGVMPLDMPEIGAGALQGQMQPGVTLRDLVHAIPLYAISRAC